MRRSNFDFDCLEDAEVGEHVNDMVVDDTKSDTEENEGTVENHLDDSLLVVVM